MYEEYCVQVGCVHVHVSMQSKCRKMEYKREREMGGRQRRSDTSDVIHQHVILIDKLIANLLHSIASRTISEHQKLLACWVHSGWGVFSTVLKLCIRLRSITAVHLALNSHMNAIWKSVTQACNVTSDWRDTFSIMKTPLNPS